MPAPPTSRAARARRASASSAARNRGARSSESKSRNATVSASGTRCNAASVPTTTRARRTCPSSRSSEAAGPHTSATSTPASASRSSRTRVTPRRNAFTRVTPHRAHTTGRSCPQRRHRSSGAGPGVPAGGPERRPRPRPVSPTCSREAPQVSQRASSPHDAHESSRTRPVRFTMQTTRRPGDPAASRTSRTSRSENSPVRGSSLRRSITSTAGQPRRSTFARWFHERSGGEDLERGTRRHERTRHPLAPGAFGHHRPGRPRRSALLVVRLVVCVEHDSGRQPRQGGEGTGAGAYDHAPTGPGPRPVAGEQRGGDARRPQPACHVARRTVTRCQHEHAGVTAGTLAARRGGEEDRPGVARRPEPDHGRPGSEAGSGAGSEAGRGDGVGPGGGTTGGDREPAHRHRGGGGA